MSINYEVALCNGLIPVDRDVHWASVEPHHDRQGIYRNMYCPATEEYVQSIMDGTCLDTEGINCDIRLRWPKKSDDIQEDFEATWGTKQVEVGLVRYECGFQFVSLGRMDIYQSQHWDDASRPVDICGSKVTSGWLIQVPNYPAAQLVFADDVWQSVLDGNDPKDEYWEVNWWTVRLEPVGATRLCSI